MMFIPSRRARKLRAKHVGKCRNCDGAITIGQLIWWTPGHGAVHADCETARLQNSLCPYCEGSGRRWNNAPCRSCDGTGSREVYEFAKAGGHPRKDIPVSQYVKDGA